MKSPEELVDAFAALMKKELEDNKHKGDWREWKNLNEILPELAHHGDKLFNALLDREKHGPTEDNQARIKEHAGDCGNILMMMVNAIDGL